MQMKISTNCSPLVIYFGFFFSRQNNHAEGGGKWSRTGGGSEATGELNRRKGGTEGTNLRIEVYFYYRGVLRLGGLPIAHTPSWRRKKVDLFGEALSHFIRPPETAFESVYCEIHSSNLDKILTVY